MSLIEVTLKCKSDCIFYEQYKKCGIINDCESEIDETKCKIICKQSIFRKKFCFKKYYISIRFYAKMYHINYNSDNKKYDCSDHSEEK
ncbi:hypothetical protein HZS_218 [Henneguya salminicola]|nr:hypothetical protein HZS_218 [Henneguya salminicola]